ncbi:hypothetical protein DXG03_000054 [Asterophora parasitica]|uniref:Uncharacterized protein n=1 Tax=Asterophora parasitica TaxID=117018 RepID=A0A9P7GDR2_9AGAR|nr:hypothetical protein DXG03_000054 [Asterophora parasitica]
MTMALIKKGRLSVQRVEEQAWNAIVALAQKGGWGDMDLAVMKRKALAKLPSVKPPKKDGDKLTKAERAEEPDNTVLRQEESGAAEQVKPSGERKRKAKEEDEASSQPRRSTRRKR